MGRWPTLSAWLFGVLRHWPVGVAVVCLGFVLTRPDEPIFVDYNDLEMGGLSDAQQHALTMATELNKYLISLATLIFGALGLYLARYMTAIPRLTLWLSLPVIVLLLCLTYYYGFATYEQFTAALTQNAFALLPGRSRALYYLEMEFWACLAASIAMFALFVYGSSLQVTGSPSKRRDD